MKASELIEKLQKAIEIVGDANIRGVGNEDDYLGGVSLTNLRYVNITNHGDIVISDEILQIPHPRIQERAFVLIPALEILDESSDYLLRKRYESFLKDLPEQGVSKYSKLLGM